MTATFIPLHTGSGITGSGITVRLGHQRPDHAVYMRRRLLVGLLILGLLAAFVAVTRSVLTDRGGVPASASAIRPATVPPAALPPSAVASAAGAAVLTPPAVEGAIAPVAPVHPAAQQYIVQPGDTIWSLAEVFHGSSSVSRYVEALVDTNGGASLEVGQLLSLP